MLKLNILGKRGSNIHNILFLGGADIEVFTKPKKMLSVNWKAVINTHYNASFKTKYLQLKSILLRNILLGHEEC